MRPHFSPPTFRQGVWCIGLWLAFYVIACLFVGLTPAHLVLTALFLLFFFLNGESRKLVLLLVPFVLFAISYDWMRVWPNYMVNPIDVQRLYETEKSLFGIPTASGVLTANEYFARHHCAVLDLMSGLFYLCWIPVPVCFCIGFFLVGKRRLSLKFSVIFLLVNWIGFIGYYVHPAAPPWYVMQYGFTPILDTPGEVAGLGRFDEMLGLNIFHGIYCHNSNVFAAVPSLHAAYVFSAFLCAAIGRCRRWVQSLLAFISVGIWFAAVYTSHHYVTDVLLGILTALAGVALFELVLMRWKPTERAFEHYFSLIKTDSI